MGISFFRTILLYVMVILAMRVMGKRQIGELQPSELVVTILISDLAAIPMQETGIPLASGVIPILTLIACEVLLSALTMVSIRFRRIVTGKPSVIIQNGQINQAEMRRVRFTMDDLLEELRLGGYKGIDEVAYAVLETNGKLSIFPSGPNTPLTAGLMNIKPSDGGLPTTLICDGQLYEKALYVAGKDQNWLEKQLDNKKIRVDQILLMTTDRLGKTIIIPKNIKTTQIIEKSPPAP